MSMNKEIMEQNAKNFLSTLFSLPEIEKVAIKDIVISSGSDTDSIRKGLSLCYHDGLSDVDISIWLCLSPEDFHGSTPLYKKYLPRLGFEHNIFGILFQGRNNNDECKEGLRICLTSGFRIDLTCYARCDLNAAPLPESDLRKTDELKKTQHIWNDWDLDHANSFWFTTIHALTKLFRNDYLIADHLTHMLLMEGLVLQMKTRDNTYQTNFHRYGYSESLEYLQIDIAPYEKYWNKKDTTFSHIAQNLCRAVLAYDELVDNASPEYQKKCDQFFTLWEGYQVSLDVSQ